MTQNILSISELRLSTERVLRLSAVCSNIDTTAAVDPIKTTESGLRDQKDSKLLALMKLSWKTITSYFCLC